MRASKRIAVAISGGVDSAVSAYLLKNKGYDLFGVFMTNWDPLDDDFDCTVQQDQKDAQYVCDKLKIPFIHHNYVKEYWNHVFESVLSDYKQGWTPNPDILCNKFIKFHSLTKAVFNNLGADFLATGHYARTQLNDLDPIPALSSSETRLYRSVDRVKDQTFWLSQVEGSVLQRVIFPVGHLMKPQVKKIAEEAGFYRTLRRKESMGMCFVGKKNFYDFIDKYIPASPGVYKDLESGAVLGEHTGIHHFTLGQKAKVARNDRAHYIVSLDPFSQDIAVVDRPDHPALFMQQFTVAEPHWINDPLDNPLPDSEPSAEVELDFQWQNKWRPIRCTLTKKSLSESSTSWHVNLAQPMRCISPGQYAVFYRGEQCLGSAKIVASHTLWHTTDPLLRPRSVQWKHQDFENYYQKTLTSTCS